jgi:hypothetical protein
MLISALVTFLVVILILYLVNLLPLDGRADRARRCDYPRRDFAAQIYRSVLRIPIAILRSARNDERGRFAPQKPGRLAARGKSKFEFNV